MIFNLASTQVWYDQFDTIDLTQSSLIRLIISCFIKWFNRNKRALFLPKAECSFLVLATLHCCLLIGFGTVKNHYKAKMWDIGYPDCNLQCNALLLQLSGYEKRFKFISPKYTIISHSYMSCRTWWLDYRELITYCAIY